MIRVLLASALLFTASSARADWREASTPHFVVYSEQPADQLTRFANELERFDTAIRRLLGAPDKPIGKANRVTVYMVDNTGEVAQLAGSDGVAGFYRPRAGGSLAIVPRRSGTGKNDLRPRMVLLHEYTHHLMWTLSPDAVYPSWYIEGFAEMLATTLFDEDGSLQIGNAPQYRADAILSGDGLPLEKLLVADSLRLDEAQTQELYGRGWLLTHYLNFGKTRPGQLAAYIAAINAGKTPRQAAAAFGDLKALDRELDRYMRARLGGLRVRGEALTVGEAAIRTLTPGEAATMDVRIRSKNGVGPKIAPIVYQAARRAAAPFPSDPAAQIVLAEAAFDAGDFAASEAAADRALAADPRSVDAHVYKAKARMGAAVKAHDTRKESWAAIRKSIATANRLDPKDPEPLILYYESFVAAGETPASIAKDGLFEAFELAPQDDDLRFNTATMFLGEGDAATGRKLLAPLAYQPHSNGMAKRAAAAIAKIDAGDVTGAVKELTTDPDPKLKKS